MFILQLERNRVTKTTEEAKCITGKYYRQSVLADVNRFYNRIRPNTGMRGIRPFRDNAPALECMLVQGHLADENIETLPHPSHSP